MATATLDGSDLDTRRAITDGLRSFASLFDRFVLLGHHFWRRGAIYLEADPSTAPHCTRDALYWVLSDMAQLGYHVPPDGVYVAFDGVEARDHNAELRDHLLADAEAGRFHLLGVRPEHTGIWAATGLEPRIRAAGADIATVGRHDRSISIDQWNPLPHGREAAPGGESPLTWLLGVCVDDRCGHRLDVRERRDDGPIMGCTECDPEWRGPLQCGDIEATVSSLVSRARFDDADLRFYIKRTLTPARTRRELNLEARRIRRRISKLRAGSCGDPAELTELEARLRDVTTLREDCSRELRSLIAGFGRMLNALGEFADAWGEADPAWRNWFLGAIGAKIRIGPGGVSSVGQAKIASIEVESTIVAFALAVGLPPDDPWACGLPKVHYDDE